MATKQISRPKRRAKAVRQKTPTLRSQNERLERELKALRAENRKLRNSLAAIVFKDDPINLDLAPEDGVGEPSLIDLIAEIERAGKK